MLLHNSTNSYLRSSDQLVAAVGVDNLVVVATTDVIIVARKNRVQDVKLIAQKLKEQARSEWKLNREVYRPWGKYDYIDHGERYQVKRIRVKPGAILSVQMQHPGRKIGLWYLVRQV